MVPGGVTAFFITADNHLPWRWMVVTLAGILTAVLIMGLILRVQCCECEE